MPNRTREEDEILAYACYRIISKYGNTEGEVDGLRFNKMMTLLDKELLDEDVDIKLPSCWYFYGPVVVPNELPRSVRFESGDLAERDKGRFYWSGDTPRPHSRDRSRINSLVDRLLTRFPRDGEVLEALDAAYEHAPFRFQQLYKEFRTDSLEKSMADPSRTFRSEWLYLNEIKASFKEFPYDEFIQLKVPATQVDILTTAIFGKVSERNSVAIALAKSFWEIFCKFLRIHELGHKHVSDQKLQHWKRIAEADLLTFLEYLQSEIGKILAFLPPDAIEDPMDMMFLDPMEFDTEEDIDTTLYG